MAWKGDSRRHSLSRKGIKTNIDQGRRFDVSNFVAKGERHTIKFQQEYRGKIYNIRVEKDRDISLTLYLAEYLFLSQLKNTAPLKSFFTHQGRLTDYERGKLENVELISIEEVTQVEEIFKEDIIFKS